MMWGELVFWKKYVFKRWEELFVGKRKENTAPESWAGRTGSQLAWEGGVDMHNSRHWVLSNMVVGCNSSVNESLFGIEYKIVFLNLCN